VQSVVSKSVLSWSMVMAWRRRSLIISTALVLSWYAALERAVEGAPTVTEERYAVAACWSSEDCRLPLLLARSCKQCDAKTEDGSRHADWQPNRLLRRR